MFFIPYKCRCEAIGGNRRRGERYKSLNGVWHNMSREKEVFERTFDLPSVWKGLLVYLRHEKNGKYNVRLNGETFVLEDEVEITDYLKSGENVIQVEPSEYGVAKDVQNVLNGFCITARPAKHISAIDINCSFVCGEAFLNITAKLQGRTDIGPMPAVTAEIYDEELDLNNSVESVFEKNDDGCFSKLSMKINNHVDCSQGEKHEYILLLLCAGEVIRQRVYIMSDRDSGCFFEEPPHETVLCKTISGGFSEEANAPSLSFNLIEGRTGVLGIKNLSSDTVPGGLRIDYKIYNQRGLYKSGVAEVSENLTSEGNAVIKLGYSIPEISPFEYFLELEVNGRIEGQFKLPVNQTVCEKSYSDDMPNIETVCENSVLNIKGENFCYSFLLDRGVFEKMSLEGVDFVEQGRGFCFPEDINCRVIASTEKYTVISGSAENDEGEFSVMWIIFGDGEISVSATCFQGESNVSPLIYLPNKFTSVDTFCDVNRCGVSLSGLYTFDISENQNISLKNVRWLLPKDSCGRGLLVKGVEPLEMFLKNDGSLCLSGNAGAFSFVLRPVLIDDEDTVREARTLPSVM